MELLTSPYSWSVVFLAIVSVLFISASFLTFYAARAKDTAALKLVRKYALFWGTPTIVMALTTFIALGQHNERHYENMIDLWWVFGLSVGFFMIAMWLLYEGRRYGLAFISVMLQFFFAFFGYGISHLPFILDPYINIFEHATHESIGRSEEHTSELQSRGHLVCRLLLE